MEGDAVCVAAVVDVDAALTSEGERAAAVGEDAGEESGESSAAAAKEDDAEAATYADPLDDPNLSKTQRKKIIKRKLKAEQTKDKKEARKMHQKQAVAKRKEESHASFLLLTEEEKAEKIAKRKMLTETRRAETEEKRKRQQQGFESGRRLIIDLEFGELMHDKEHKSLMSQLMYCYAANSSSAQPCRLVLTGVAGETKERYDQIPGQEQWKVERHEQPYIDAYADQKDSLVYLTADSTNEISTLDESKIYIVGGIVDHNRYKDLTLEKAQKQGIAHARLPIGEEIKLIKSRVLTVNQMLDILINYQDTKDWTSALKKAIPKRKRGGSDSEDEAAGEVEAEAVEAEEEEGEPTTKAAKLEEPSAKVEGEAV